MRLQLYHLWITVSRKTATSIRFNLVFYVHSLSQAPFVDLSPVLPSQLYCEDTSKGCPDPCPALEGGILLRDSKRSLALITSPNENERETQVASH